MTILSPYTKKKHAEAESTDFVQYMFSGKITIPHYVTYLQQMLHIYSTLEYLGEINGLFHDMQDIKRARAIEADLREFDVEINVPALPSTEKYKNHLYKLHYNGQGKELLAHVYVRHMGDLYGGKVIAKRTPGSGFSYQFLDRPAMIEVLTSKLTMELLPEALSGFDFCIDIFNELTSNIKEQENDNTSRTPAD